MSVLKVKMIIVASEVRAYFKVFVENGAVGFYLYRYFKTTRYQCDLSTKSHISSSSVVAFKRLDGTMDCCSNNSLTDLCFSYIKPQGRNSREREVKHTHTHAYILMQSQPFLTNSSCELQHVDCFLNPVLWNKMVSISSAV